MAAAQDLAETSPSPAFPAWPGAGLIRLQLFGLMAGFALSLIVAFAIWFPALPRADADNVLYFPAAAALLLLALGFGLAFAFARRLGEFSATLAAAVAAFARGERRRVACHGPAELRAVAQAWNAMLDAAASADFPARQEPAPDAREQRRREQLLHGVRLLLQRETASSLAHEIGQPLTAIAGYSSACARLARASPETLALLRKIDAQVARAGELAWRTGDASRRLRGREAIDLPALIFEALDGASGEAHRYAIALDPSGVDRTLPAVRADRLQLEQVLHNLLKNAFDAVREVDTPRRVAVAAHRHGGDLIVSLTDTGGGVPPPLAQALFQPFFTTRPGGLGLGLAISRSIVEAHGGSLWHAPLAGGGAAFSFSLPTDLEFPSDRV